MIRDRLDAVGVPEALLVGLGIALGVALVVSASTSSVAFGAFNPAWDGADDLRNHAETSGRDVVLVRTVEAYRGTDADGTIAIVISPSTAYGPAETDRLAAFVRAGGTLLVAEDFGPHGNGVLEAVGAGARFDGRALRDDRRFYRSPALPIVTPATDLEAVDRVTLNHATAVTPNGATVLIATSPTAYLDENGNGRLDPDEAVRPWPAATTEAIGEGRVVALGDPSALINVMLERPGNRAFLEWLYEGHDRVLLDYSHAATLPPMSLAVIAVRGSTILQIAVGIGVLGAVGLWAVWPRIRGQGRREAPGSPRVGTGLELDERTVRAVLRDRHPDWDAERLDRLTTALMATRTEPDPDE